MAHTSNRKTFSAGEIRTEKIGVHQHPNGPGPLSYVDVSGDAFANQYRFGKEEIQSLSNITIDFDNDIVQTIELDRDVYIETANRSYLSNRLKAATVKLRAIDADRKLDFHGGIHFLGNIPTGLQCGKIGILSLNSFGPHECDTVAVYRTEGEYLVGIPEPSVLFNKKNQITGESCFSYDTDKCPYELQVGGHILPCTGLTFDGHQYSTSSFDLGSYKKSWRNLYLSSEQITIDNVNAKYYVPKDPNPTGCGNHAIGSTGSYTDYNEFISKEIILTTKNVDFNYTGEHVIGLPHNPENKLFYVDELGIIITHADTVTSGLNVEFGYSGNSNGLINELHIETPLEQYDRERFMTPKSSCGLTNLMATITTGAISTSLSGRFYYKGIFIENEY